MATWGAPRIARVKMFPQLSPRTPFCSMSSKSTVAVVEDDDDIRANVCSYLERSGFGAWGAESAEDFYVRLLRNRADLVVVDIGLPGEDGLSLVTRLATQGVPTVLMTARADLDTRIAGLDAGALQYFVKPVDMQELTAGIRSQLRHKAPRAAEGESLAPWRLDRAAGRLVAPNQQGVDLRLLLDGHARCAGHQTSVDGSRGRR